MTHTLKVEGRLNPKRHVSDLKPYHERTEKVSHILNIRLHKSLQMFNARRPLPEAMRNYAANDAIFTLKCWNALKVIMGDILIQQSSTLLHASKEAVTRQYSFPKVKMYDAGIFSNLFKKFNSNSKLA
jgi:hypothetical protein